MGGSSDIYTERWAILHQKIYSLLPAEHKHLVVDLEEEFRRILRNRNEKLREYMERCGDL